MCIKIKVDFGDDKMLKYMRENYINYFFHLDNGNSKEIYIIPKKKAYTDSKIRRKYVNN